MLRTLIAVFFLAITMAFPTSAHAQVTKVGKLGCFEKNYLVTRVDMSGSVPVLREAKVPFKESKIYLSLGNVLNQEQLYAASDSNIPLGGSCFWGSVGNQFYESYLVDFSEQNGIIAAVWEIDKAGDNLIWSFVDAFTFKASEFRVYRDYRHCKRDNMEDFGACVVPKNCAIAIGFETFARKENINYPSYVELPASCFRQERKVYRQGYDDRSHSEHRGYRRNDGGPYRR